MAAVTKLTGANGIVYVNGVGVAVSDFTMNLKRGSAVQSRVGKYSDRKKPGKLEVTGSLTNLDIMGDHIGRLLNSGAGVTTETKTVLQNCDTIGQWTSSDPTNTPIAAEATIKKEGTNALKITPSGALSASDTVTSTVAAKDLSGHHFIDFWIRSSVTGAVIKIGIGEAAITEQEKTITIQTANVWQNEYWDISAIADASKNAITKVGFTIIGSVSGTIYIDDINSHKGVRIGAGATMTIYGDAVQGTDRVKINADNCVTTSGSMKFGSADAFIDGPIEFAITDADADLQLTYT